MRKIILILCPILLVFALAGTTTADLILFEDFEGTSGLTISGNASYWGVAPLVGTQLYPSQFLQGGSQAGMIFYGVNAYDSTATMTISLPDLSGYTDLQLTMALAAPDGTRWESTHRDSLIISGTTGLIDSFLPVDRGAPLRSQLMSIDLHYAFQDFNYIVDNSLESLIFAFASTADNEFIGIDSVRITGTPSTSSVPDASVTLLLGTSFLFLAVFSTKFKIN